MSVIPQHHGGAVHQTQQPVPESMINLSDLFMLSGDSKCTSQRRWASPIATAVAPPINPPTPTPHQQCIEYHMYDPYDTMSYPPASLSQSNHILEHIQQQQQHYQQALCSDNVINYGYGIGDRPSSALARQYCYPTTGDRISPVEGDLYNTPVGASNFATVEQSVTPSTGYGMESIDKRSSQFPTPDSMMDNSHHWVAHNTKQHPLHDSSLPRYPPLPQQDLYNSVYHQQQNTDFYNLCQAFPNGIVKGLYPNNVYLMPSTDTNEDHNVGISESLPSLPASFSVYDVPDWSSSYTHSGNSTTNQIIDPLAFIHNHGVHESHPVTTNDGLLLTTENNDRRHGDLFYPYQIDGAREGGKSTTPSLHTAAADDILSLETAGREIDTAWAPQKSDQYQAPLFDTSLTNIQWLNSTQADKIVAKKPPSAARKRKKAPTTTKSNCENKDPELNRPSSVLANLLSCSSVTVKQLIAVNDTGHDTETQKLSKKKKKNNNPQNKLLKMNDPSGKPPYSYMLLIQFSLNSVQSKRMTLSCIYEWIQMKFPFYSNGPPGWKNSIRHNLSQREMFVRIPPAIKGEKSFWTFLDQSLPRLTLEEVQRKAQRTQVPPVEGSAISNSNTTVPVECDTNNSADGASDPDVKDIDNSLVIEPLFTKLPSNTTDTCSSTPDLQTPPLCTGRVQSTPPLNPPGQSDNENVSASPPGDDRGADLTRSRNLSVQKAEAKFDECLERTVLSQNPPGQKVTEDDPYQSPLIDPPMFLSNHTPSLSQDSGFSETSSFNGSTADLLTLHTVQRTSTPLPLTLATPLNTKSTTNLPRAPLSILPPTPNYMNLPFHNCPLQSPNNLVIDETPMFPSHYHGYDPSHIDMTTQPHPDDSPVSYI